MLIVWNSIWQIFNVLLLAAIIGVIVFFNNKSSKEIGDFFGGMGCLRACPAPSLTAGIHCKAASLAMSNLHFFWKWLATSKPVLLGRGGPQKVSASLPKANL